MDESRPLRIVLVSNGDAADPTMVSGVPYYFSRAFARRSDVQVATINAKPARPLRWLARALSWHPVRTVWDARYVHSTFLARMRSWIRDWHLHRLGYSPDLVIHVRSWYLPPRNRYAAFIDATADMLQGVTPSWTSPPKTHARKKKVESHFYQSADIVFCASHDAAVDLETGYGVDPTKISIVGGGVNFDSYPEEPTRSQVTEKQILFVGKDPDRKGLPDLLEAFGRLKKIHEDVALLVVGCSGSTDIPGVTFRGSVESRAEMAQLYRSSAIFCLPSRQESFGLVVPEAAAHGLPCVVSDVGELPRLVSHGTTGLVVSPQKPDELFAALDALVSDPDCAASMGRQAWVATKSITWEAVTDRMMQSAFRRPSIKDGDHIDTKKGGRADVR